MIYTSMEGEGGRYGEDGASFLKSFSDEEDDVSVGRGHEIFDL